MAGNTGTTIIVAQADGASGEAHAVVDNGHDDAALTTGTEAHGGEAHEAFPPFDPATFGPQLFWLFISFGLLYLLMSRVALPRIGEILEVRRDRIEGDLAEADRLRQKTDQAVEAYEAALAEARQKAHGIAEETRSEIKSELDGKRTEVETDLSKKMSAAEARIQQTKTDALSHVGEIAAETAETLVSQISSKVTAKQAKDAVAKVVKG